MAVNSNTNLTLADWAKSRDPNGKIAVLANLLSQTNEILPDMVVREANGPTSHRVVVATGLPTIYYRAVNLGIASSKGQRAQVDEPMAYLEARSEVDKLLATLETDIGSFRLSEAELFREGLNQAVASGLFYNNPSSDSKLFLGLAPRYSSTAAPNGQNIILGGGTTANVQTSIWLIGWGDNTVYTIFPKGSQAGLYQQDLGEQTIVDMGGTGLRAQGLVELFQWHLGLVVKDWRYAVRVPNIEVSQFAGLTGSQSPTAFTNILHKMAAACSRLPNANMARPAFYMNRTVFAGLQRIALEKSYPALRINDALTQFGTINAMMTFMGIPIRKVDAIVNTEAIVA